MLSTDKQTNKQTNRQTNQHYQKHNLLCQGGNKGFIQCTQHKDKDKDKDKDEFIGPKEFVSHLMMTQTKDKLFHQLK